MAYILKTIGKTANIPFKHFECDDVADLDLIDTADVIMGSTCYVINKDVLYTLNSNKEWKVRSEGGGIGSNISVDEE
jgi:hypothetical protein